MSSHEAAIVSASRKLLQRLTPGGLDATLHNITQAAVEVLPQVQYASISLRHEDGTLSSCAATDDVASDLDDRQHQLREGPGYDADQAAVAVAYSIEIETLHEAVQTRTRIGQAVGIVMERHKVTDRQAFAFLTRLSQNRNVKVRQIADRIIEADLRS